LLCLLEGKGFARGDIDSILLLQIAYPEVTVLGTATGFHPAVGALGKLAWNSRIQEPEDAAAWV